MAISQQDQITNALADYRIWEFGNEILYRLCADHPAHWRRRDHRQNVAGRPRLCCGGGKAARKSRSVK